MLMNPYYRMGQVFAVLNQIAQRQGQTLSLDAVLASPLAQFGLHMREFEPCKHPALNARIAALVDGMDTMPTEALANEQQGDFFLGYYNETNELTGKCKKKGRPLAEESRDWSLVDWTKTDTQLSREMGVARQTVRWHRQKRS